MFTTPTHENLTSTTLNLRRLVILRNIGILGQALVIGVADKWLDLQLALGPLAVILLALAGWNFFTFWRARQARTVPELEFFAQLLIDVLALTCVLYFTGGATNPFAWFFLLPLVIAATVLPKIFVWIMAGITVSCYSILMWQYIPLTPVHMSHGSGFEQHVFGMWFGFVLSAGIVSYFVSGMANTLRDRDRILAEAREQSLRDEHLVALGTLAAGAAHELGTPLGTMAIVAGELEHDYSADKDRELNERLTIIKEQIARCKQALSVISASAGEVRAESGRSIPVKRYLEDLINTWSKDHPDIKLVSSLDGIQPSPHIVAEYSINQALTNILNNAADASPDSVKMDAHWDNQELVIEVINQGQQLSDKVSAAIGKTPITTKEQGLGLGLFLSHAVISRMGGNVTLFNREDGCVCTRIVLPLIEISTGIQA